MGRRLSGDHEVMVQDKLNVLIRNIHYVIGARQYRDTLDYDLLQRYASHRDEAAFAALLHRHGPMVLGVCRRVLHNAADADDAFQATFLVLVRKAKSIRKGASVGSWLHGVAFRVACEAKIKARPQSNGEMQDLAGGDADPCAEAERRELRSILDKELDQLPAKYRSPLVLHYLEGKTKEETARELGWTEGTVSGRLARARESLRKRLDGRELLLSEGMMVAMLSQQLATSVPSALANATMKSALLFNTGGMAGGAASGASQVLAEAVLKTMFVSKLKHGIALAIVLVAVASGLGVAGHAYWPVPPPQEPEEPRLAQASPPKPLPEELPEPPVDPEEEALVAELKKIGAEVIRDEKRLGKPVVEVGLPGAGTRLAWEIQFKLKNLKSLRKLRLLPGQFSTDLDDGDLTFLGDLKNLQSLEMYSNAFIGGFLKNLKAPENLQTLILHSGVTDAVQDGLGNLKNLQELSLAECIPRGPGAPVLSNGGLNGLKYLTKLRSLSIRSNHVTGEILKELRYCEGLQSLFLAGEQVTDVGMEDLKYLKNLQTLNLASTRVTDAGLSALKDLTNLQLLNLPPSAVSGAVLKDLNGLKSLKELTLGWTWLTAEDLKDPKDLTGLKHLARVNKQNPPLHLIYPRNLLDLKALNLSCASLDTKKLEELKGLESLNLAHCRLKDGNLEGFHNLTSLQWLNLTGTPGTDVTGVTDAGMKELDGLKNLQWLYLNLTQVSDTGLKELKDLPSLQTLNLTGCKKVTGSGLNGLKSLRSLYLPHAGLTDAGLACLKDFENLESLDLGNTQVTDVVMNQLKGLKNLKSLVLWSTRVTDAGLKDLIDLPSLRRLALPQGVTDEGLKHLHGLRSLHTLYLGENLNVTDAGLIGFKDCKSLKILYITSTSLRNPRDGTLTTAYRDTVLKKVREALPTVDIREKIDNDWPQEWENRDPVQPVESSSRPAS
jgi:RNA polymerase sigma factor (sigma-70 family)